MNSQEILKILKENLEIEEFARRKSEILNVIKIIENESLYNAILYDFLTIRYVCQMNYDEAYQIPEVRRVFLDCIKNPNLKTPNPKSYGFDTVALVTDKVSVKVLMNDSELNQIIADLTYEQGARLFDGKEAMKLFDYPKYYEILSKKALEDPRFYKLFPYSKQCIENGTLDKILEYDDELRGLSQQDDQLILDILKSTTKPLKLTFILRNIKKYGEELQKFIISKKEYAIQLIYLQANIDYNSPIIPVDLEDDLIQNNLNVFNEISYNQKYNFISNMNDPVMQKYLIQKLKFMDNIRSHPNFGKIFLNIKDKEFMLECLLKKDILDNMSSTDLRKVLQELSPEYQQQLYDNKIFKEYFTSISRYDALQLLGYFDEKIIDELLEKLPKVSINEKMTIFKTNKNHKYLKEVMKSIEESEQEKQDDLESNINYFCKNYVFVKETLKELTNEEFEFFLKRYNNIKEIKDAINFVDLVNTKTPLSESDMASIENIDFTKPVTEEEKNILFQYRENILYEKQLKQAIEVISKENGRIINKFSYAIFESLNEEEIKMVLDHLTIECLIVLISVSSNVVDYCYDLYQNDPTAFDNVGELPYIYITYNGEELTKDSIDKLVNMYSNLSSKAQESILNEALLEKEEIQKVVKDKLASDPNTYSGKIIRKKIQPIYTREEFKTLIEQLSLYNFMLLVSEHSFLVDDKYGDVIEEVFKSRQEEVLYKVTTDNENEFYEYNSDSLLKKIINNSSDKKSILDRLSIKKIILLYESFNSSFLKKDNGEMISLLFESLVRRQKELIEIRDDDLKKLLSIHNPKDLSKLISEFNTTEMIELFARTLNKDLEDKLVHEFIKQPYFKNNTEYSLEEIFSRLEPSNKEIICNCIDEDFKTLEIPFDIKNKLRKVSYDEKIFLIYGAKQNILNEEKYKLINELLEKDPFAINSLNIELFEDKIFEISKRIIPKIYRYESLTKDYLKLLNSKNKNSKIMLLLIEHLNRTTPNMDIYAKKLSSIINYLSNSEDINIKKYNLNNISEEELCALEEYICLDDTEHLISQEITVYIFTKSVPFKGNTFKEINNKRIMELDEKMLSSTDIKIVKDCLFQKYFKLTLDQVENILRKYDTSLEKVKDNINNQEHLVYYNEIKNIFNSNNIDELKKYYYENNKVHRLEECLYVFEEFNKIYNESIAANLKGYKNGKHTTIQISENDTMKHVGVIELETDFDLIVHSTDAYGSMEMINENYFDSWNYSEKTSNHGICTSYISNSNLGTAAVKGKGVMFGFTKLNSKSISSMAPYDLVSKNDGVITTTRRPPMYTSVDDLADYTRHTHNELVLERRNVSNDSLYPVIQPDCLIIFEEMDDKIKQNTIKAREDFKAMGIDLPIIYINRKKVAEKEARRVEEMLNIYDQNPNIELLAEIINKYESNRCGEDFEQNFKTEDIFDKERIYNAILKTIELIKTSNDANLAKKLIDVINHENYKFTLINETVGERAHKFDLLDEKLLQELQELEKVHVSTLPEFNSSFAI